MSLLYKLSTRLLPVCMLSAGLQACEAPAESVPGAPGVTLAYEGTAVNPWPGVNTLLLAAVQVLGETYPTHPELQNFVVEVYGANDLMAGDTIPDGYVVEADGTEDLLMGTTDRRCNLRIVNDLPTASCFWRIRIRQTKAIATPKVITTNGVAKAYPHWPIFSGSLLGPDASALAYEISVRMCPERLGLGIGGTDTGFDQLQATIVARYEKLISK